MGMQMKFLGGYKDGEIDVYASTTAYVAGQFLSIRTDGTLELCTAYTSTGADEGYAGVAYGFSGSTSIQLSDLYNGKATYVAGYNKLRLDNDDPRNSSDGYPYVRSTTTYTPGEDLYVGATGLWANAIGGTPLAAANSIIIGYVIDTPSGAAEADPTYLYVAQIR